MKTARRKAMVVPLRRLRCIVCKSPNLQTTSTPIIGMHGLQAAEVTLQ